MSRGGKPCAMTGLACQSLTQKSIDADALKLRGWP